MSNTFPHLIHLKYRPDIDGLRAVAIISVVIFHTYPTLLTGGFVGVDVFFVISGFLISKIIFSSLEHDRFSIVEFYVRRIRRIFPALIVVMISTLIIGWFLLLSPEFKRLGEHVAGGALFSLNFILWRESSYFDVSSVYKPLLHLWSLGIEEQFYIVWPLLLTLVWKKRWGFLWITGVVAVASFLSNIYLINRSPVSAFYLPNSRFWELMIGGILAYISLHRSNLLDRYRNLQSLAGFALLAIALFTLKGSMAFPGGWALLPTIGAFLIISAGPDASLNKQVLSNRAMVWIGIISYPLYLWHWVLLSFLRIDANEASRWLRLGAIIISLLLSWGTYKWVEMPLRKGRRPRFKAAALLASMVTVLCAGCVIFQQNGLEKWGASDRAEYVNYFQHGDWESRSYRHDCDFYDLAKDRAGERTSIPRPAINRSCYVRRNTFDHAVFLWGDSHVQQLYAGLKKYMPANWQILIVASSGCHPNPDVSSGSRTAYCQQSNWFALQSMAKAHPDVVVVAQDRGHNIEMMNRIASRLQEMGIKRVIFTGPVPQWHPDLPHVIAKKLWYNTPHRTYVEIRKGILNEDKRVKQAFKQEPNVIYASLIDFFCNQQGCLTYLGNDRKTGLTSWDYGHLTSIASDYLAKGLLVQLITGSGNPYLKPNTTMHLQQEGARQ